MKSTNEWGQLRKVIVGVANNARIPETDLSMRVVNYADQETVDAKVGDYPHQVITEMNEDLLKLSEFLCGEGVKVLRAPNASEPVSEYYQVCPRDSVFIHGDLALATPMPIRARKNDYQGIRQYIPNLTVISPNFEDSLYNENCVGNKDILALNETAPAFDAANVLRANDDILYLVSNSGNRRGAELLQTYVDAKVSLLENVYSYMHIDSTIAFLREGLMLVHPGRIEDRSQLPEAFRGWDIIKAPEPTDIGHYPGYCNASPWVNVNLLSVNENLVVMEENQHETRKVLERHGIECAMLPMRHARTMGGTFHCVTLDLERDVA